PSASWSFAAPCGPRPAGRNYLHTSVSSHPSHAPGIVLPAELLDNRSTVPSPPTGNGFLCDSEDYRSTRSSGNVNFLDSNRNAIRFHAVSLNGFKQSGAASPRVPVTIRGDSPCR